MILHPKLNFGMTREKFIDDYFEINPLFIDSCFDASQFDWNIFDRALNFQDPREEMFKVLRGGRVKVNDYVENYVDIGLSRKRIKKDRLYAHLKEGATLVLNRIELCSESMRGLCQQVGRFVGAQTTANAYACLGGPPATNVHWDTHDVVVLQLSGAKQWAIHEPTFTLPISSQVSTGRHAEVPAVPILNVTLEAGDALYVPRGWWHRVAPVPDRDTIHLTVALHTPLMLDYLIWACSNVLPDSVELRRALIGRKNDMEIVQDAARRATEVVTDSKTYDAFVSRARAGAFG
jgi:ribosomal protein L16 Arg81 hydroxylase